MMILNRTFTDEQSQVRRQFLDFLEASNFSTKYADRLHHMMTEGKSRLTIDASDLLEFPEAADDTGALYRGIIGNPSKFIPLCEIAVHDVVLRKQPDYLKVDYRSRAVHVGFEGPIGKILGPRELYARHLNTMVALEGVLTRQSPLRPRMLQTVHYCPETNKYTQKEYRDQLSPLLDASHLPTVNVMPRTDMKGNALRTELGLSQFCDSQMAILQEAPERAPTGQLPRSVELRFDDDLVDCAKPGDRLVIVGTYSPYNTSESKSFETIILVNHVIHHQTLSRIPRILPTDLDKLKAYCSRFPPTQLLSMLSRSIAPSIYGMSNEKKAILLMMIGGVERHAHNTRIRGDINILFVGEPSTAKSQLLRFVIGAAPLALSTTGKGSSGVGLTAAVSTDSYTGERSLSAGAMVLADRGVLCIDEFDKMSPQDRVAMHEAMEQQTVTIAKAGIHATLNARCSVLAAANPIYGFYSVKHKLAFNVGLPESLLSRFDLTFIILDQHSSEHNRRIGKHILNNHLRAPPVPFEQHVTRTVVSSEAFGGAAGGSDGARGNPENEIDQWLAAADDGATNAGGAGGRREAREGDVDFSLLTSSDDANNTSTTSNNNNQQQQQASSSSSALSNAIMPLSFLTKYMHYAKNFTPMLTEASQQLISEHYVNLRAEQADAGAGRDGFSVGPRTLESLVRLSTAHAKVRLTNTVEEVDVEAAMGLLRASVQAAGDAQQARDQDKRTTVAEVSSAAAATADGGGNSPQQAGDDGSSTRPRGGDSDERPSKSARTDTSTSAPDAGTSAASLLVGDSVSRALTHFVGQQRTAVALHEVRDRVVHHHRQELDLPQLLVVVRSLMDEGAPFAYSESDNMIYFTG